MSATFAIPVGCIAVLLCACESGKGGSLTDGGTPGPDAGATNFISKSSASAWESEAALAASRQGENLVSAWVGRSTPGVWFGKGTAVIGYAFSRDGGGTWTPASTMAFPGKETPYNVRVADDARGGFWAVYLARSSTSKDAIVVARAQPGATSFAAPVEVTNPNAFDYNTEEGRGYDLPTVIGHRGGVFAAYGVFKGSCIGTQVARSTDGLTWAQTDVGPCEGTIARNLNALCASEGASRIWLANGVIDAQNPSASKMTIELRHSDDGGKTFPPSSLQVISNPGELVSVDPLACAMQGDDLWLTYGITNDKPAIGVFGKSTSVAAVRVSSTGVITRYSFKGETPGAKRFSMHPNIAVDSKGAVNVVYLAGDRDDDPQGELASSRLPMGASTFEPPRSVAAPFLFNQQWGERGFLGDYFGLVTQGPWLSAAFAFQGSDDAHIAFKRWSATPGS